MPSNSEKTPKCSVVATPEATESGTRKVSFNEIPNRPKKNTSSNYSKTREITRSNT